MIINLEMKGRVMIMMFLTVKCFQCEFLGVEIQAGLSGVAAILLGKAELMFSESTPSVQRCQNGFVCGCFSLAGHGQTMPIMLVEGPNAKNNLGSKVLRQSALNEIK